jgi:hypothetical protein
MADHAALVERFGRALNEGRAELLADVLAEDFVEEYPQSGEVIHGLHNVISIIQNYPGRKDATALGNVETLNAKGFDAFRPVGPTFAVVRVEGASDSGVSTIRATYPDGSRWWIVGLYTLRGGKIAHLRTFFAPDFPAPEWRAQWVERRPG